PGLDDRPALWFVRRRKSFSRNEDGARRGRGCGPRRRCSRGAPAAVAGPPGLVDAVKARARDAQAPCYADPFLPGTQKLSLADRLGPMLRRPAEEPAMVAPVEARQSLRRAG